MIYSVARRVLGHWLAFFLACSGLLLVGGKPAWASFLDVPQARSFVDRMVAEHGFDRHQIEYWLSQARPRAAILNAMSRPAEKTLQWKNYRKIFLTSDRIRLGVAFMKRYHDALDRARRRFGVPPAMVTAIIGVETMYGRRAGHYRVIDALSTLAFKYPPRSVFFRKELEQYLMLAREQDFDPMDLRGSYAGAMGYGQFMPSSYRQFAIDFDGDGIADIIHDPVDAIGSVANYFAQHGWQEGRPVVRQVLVRRASAKALVTTDLQPAHTVAELRRAGLHLGEAIKGNQPANLLKLMGAKGAEFFVTFRNFFTITRYNHSALYAMAVTDLSRALTKRVRSSGEVAGR